MSQLLKWIHGNVAKRFSSLSQVMLFNCDHYLCIYAYYISSAIVFYLYLTFNANNLQNFTCSMSTIIISTSSWCLQDTYVVYAAVLTECENDRESANNRLMQFHHTKPIRLHCDYLKSNYDHNWMKFSNSGIVKCTYTTFAASITCSLGNLQRC